MYIKYSYYCPLCLSLSYMYMPRKERETEYCYKVWGITFSLLDYIVETTQEKGEHLTQWYYVIAVNIIVNTFLVDNSKTLK